MMSPPTNPENDDESVFGGEPESTMPPTDALKMDAAPATSAKASDVPENLQRVCDIYGAAQSAYGNALRASKEWSRCWAQVARMAEDGLAAEKKLTDGERALAAIDFKKYFMFMSVRGRVLSSLQIKSGNISFPDHKTLRKKIAPHADVLDTDDAILKEIMGEAVSPEILAFLRKTRDDMKTM